MNGPGWLDTEATDVWRSFEHNRQNVHMLVSLNIQRCKLCMSSKLETQYMSAMYQAGTRGKNYRKGP